jgi:hypothetical protein
MMLTSENCTQMLNVLQKSYEFAHQFNSEMQLRQALWTAGEANSILGAICALGSFLNGVWFAHRFYACRR